MDMTPIIRRIFALYDDYGFEWSEISESMETEFDVELSGKECDKIYRDCQISINEDKSYTELHTYEDEDLRLPKLNFCVKNKKVVDKMKSVQFLDIETSLINAMVFRTGLQDISADQLTSSTRVLSVAGGSLYDLFTKGEEGVWGKGNHNFKSFKEDPLDDTELLRYVWNILDKASVVIAHNARFDQGWLFGRFMELGWKLPSKFSLICTYRNLHDVTLTSKTLNYLSKTLAKTEKIKTNIDLWLRCSKGDTKAFEEMLTYNKGDIYPTLYQVYIKTCMYYPDKAVDLSDYTSAIAQCKITGEKLQKLDKKHFDRTTGLLYYIYRNTSNGLLYRDRYNTTSAKADKGYIRFFK
jgi:hypothetical protein